jgi:uncharacterized membrane-anchored protein YhcB (DUF1043 family)
MDYFYAWLVAVGGVCIGFIVSYFKGRNAGATEQQLQQKVQQQIATQKANEVQNEINATSNDDLRARAADEWVRK